MSNGFRIVSDTLVIRTLCWFERQAGWCEYCVRVCVALQIEGASRREDHWRQGDQLVAVADHT